MPTARDVLSRLKWSEPDSFSRIEVAYLHRGAPGDVRVISGSDIAELGRSFFSTGGTEIPYHRIRRVTLDGQVLFERGRRSR